MNPSVRTAPAAATDAPLTPRVGWRAALHATPMRLTLRLVALFALISLLSFALTWWLANAALLDSVEQTLEQQIDELRASRDPRQIARAVARLIEHVDADDLIVRYDGPDGATGNYRATLPAPTGTPRAVFLDDKASDVRGTFYVLSDEVAGGRLTVGRSDDAFAELREVFVQVAAYTLLPTLALVLAAGLVLALRTVRRLAAIEGTLARLTAGDLAARLPAMPGPADDLSRVGAAVDRLASVQQASVSALRQVSADIAHDLKTPIQRLAVHLDEVALSLPADAPVATDAALARARAEVDGIVATFQALLRIAQIEGGSPRARFARVDLAELAATLADVYEPAAEEAGHRLHLHRHGPAWVQGDRTLLGQVIANLIENALRHTPPGSTVTVEVGLASAGRVRLSVADDGPGIPAAEREAVLRRLYRLDRSRSTPGSGLGLALVDAIVKLHEGALRLGDNAPGLRVEVEMEAVREAVREK